MVRTRFADHHFVAGFQETDHGGAAGHFYQIRLAVRHLNGEGGDGNGSGGCLADFLHRLAVRHDEFGRRLEVGNHFRDAVFAYRKTLGVAVQNLSDSLHLRHDEAALGGAGINRGDEKNGIPRGDESFRHRAIRFRIRLSHFDDGFAQRVDTFFFFGGNDDVGKVVLFGNGKNRVLWSAEIGLVENDDGGGLILCREFHEAQFVIRHLLRAADDEGYVHPPQNGEGFFDAQLSQFPHVVDPCGIDVDHRPDGSEFRGFFNGVGCCARDVAHDRN